MGSSVSFTASMIEVVVAVSRLGVVKVVKQSTATAATVVSGVVHSRDLRSSCGAFKAQSALRFRVYICARLPAGVAIEDRSKAYVTRIRKA